MQTMENFEKYYSTFQNWDIYVLYKMFGQKFRHLLEFLSILSDLFTIVSK